MSKYTAEQVERAAIGCENMMPDHAAPEMLRAYAALLRERESVKTVVKDIKPVAWRCRQRNGMGHWRYIEYGTRRPDSYELRECEIENVYDQAALEAVAPMLASARSVEAPAWPGYSQGEPPPKDWTRMDVNNLASARVPDSEWLELADVLDKFTPTGGPGPLWGAGASFAYSDAAKTIRAKLAAAPKPETEE